MQIEWIIEQKVNLSLYADELLRAKLVLRGALQFHDSSIVKAIFLFLNEKWEKKSRSDDETTSTVLNRYWVSNAALILHNRLQDGKKYVTTMAVVDGVKWQTGNDGGGHKKEL